MLRGFFLLGTFLGAASVGGRPGEAAVRSISLTRVVRIRSTTLSAQDTGQTTTANADTLLLSPGAPDELPEGPDGFDLLDDGSFLLTDPLRRRIAIFSSQGAFLREWKIDFAADSVTVAANGAVLAREASTGDLHAFDREGNSRTNGGTALPQPAEARLLTTNSGTVARPGGGVIQVQFSMPGLRLLSLESLATDADGSTYVALESTAAGGADEGINLNKYVRKYSADGKLVCEIAGIPLDYYVRPVDEFRVHKGVVYQLMTTKSEVRINVWDTK
jgi:hypothetical protein